MHTEKTKLLKPGMRIKLPATGEIFVIDEVIEDDLVNMTSTRPVKFAGGVGMEFREQFFMIRLVNFEIVDTTPLAELS